MLRQCRLVHLAHLSQVDCQFGSRPKPLQNNNLQLESGLFRSTWLTLRTHTGEGNCGKMCEMLSPERYAEWENGGVGITPGSFLIPQLLTYTVIRFGVRNSLAPGRSLVRKPSEDSTGLIWSCQKIADVTKAAARWTGCGCYSSVLC